MDLNTIQKTTGYDSFSADISAVTLRSGNNYGTSQFAGENISASELSRIFNNLSSNFNPGDYGSSGTSFSNVKQDFKQLLDQLKDLGQQLGIDRGAESVAGTEDESTNSSDTIKAAFENIAHQLKDVGRQLGVDSGNGTESLTGSSGASSSIKETFQNVANELRQIGQELGIESGDESVASGTDGESESSTGTIKESLENIAHQLKDLGRKLGVDSDSNSQNVIVNNNTTTAENEDNDDNFLKDLLMAPFKLGSEITKGIFGGESGGGSGLLGGLLGMFTGGGGFLGGLFGGK